MDANSWESLPWDLLVEILHRLNGDATAVVRCAAACKPWRRAIIANGSCLSLRHDRFNPRLLLGFFHRQWRDGRHIARLQHVPGPFENVLAADVVDGEPHGEPLSSRDGHLLLGGGAAGDLCLCNPMAGTRRSVPAAALGVSSPPCRFVLVTGNDGGGGGGVWILCVVQGTWYLWPGMRYQVFSSVSGEWGPVRWSAIVEDNRRVHLCDDGAKDVVVCRDAVVYYLAASIAGHGHAGSGHRFVVAIDVRTERTWTVELPPERFGVSYSTIAMAAAEDGRLSVVVQLPGNQMEVWVLTGGGGDDDDGRWTLRRTIDVQGLVPKCCLNVEHVRLSGFCPRSGCLFADVDGQDLLVDVHRGSVRLTERFGVGRAMKYAYEMDWPTYISKMKYF